MPDARRSADAAGPSLPSQEVRTVLSLLIFLHLFSLSVAVLGYGNSAQFHEQFLGRRLLDVLSPYLDTLNFNLAHRYRVEGSREQPIDPIARYYLTRGMHTDIDFGVEITANRQDGGATTVTVPPEGAWGEQRRRYQALANAIGTLAGNDGTAGGDTAELILPKAVAGGALAELGASRGTIRCRGHLLLSPAAVASSTAGENDPFDARYYENVFDAQVLASGGRVDLLKTAAAGEVAPVEKGK